MKKLIVAIGVISTLLFLGKVMAATPTDQMSQNRTSYIVPSASTAAPSPLFYPVASNWNTLIGGSSVSATSGGALLVAFPVVQTTMTFTNGISNSTFSARNCLTDLAISLSSGSTFYVLDGNTTSYAIPGTSVQAYSGAAVGMWAKHWDHLGPFCGTTGNALTLTIGAATGGSGTNAISAEGYTLITGLASIYNIGQ